MPLDIVNEQWSLLDISPQQVPQPKVFEPTDDGNEFNSDLPIEPPRGWDSNGTEVLAWYSPFHQCRWDWGIYVRAFGIDVVAEQLRAGGVPPISAPEVARAFLFGHEFGHFRAELLTAGAEVASRQALYLTGKRRQHATAPGWGLAEEGLCNALGRTRIPRPYAAALDGWLSTSPVGYRDHKRHTASRRAASWAEVVGDITGAAPLAWSPVPGTPTFQGAVPVFLVLDGSGPDGWPRSALLGAITVNESDDFMKDLEKSGNAKAAIRAWNSTKTKMQSGALHAGCHLEHLRERIYSVRTGSSARAGLIRHTSGQWEAVLYDQQHDRFYRRLKGLMI